MTAKRKSSQKRIFRPHQREGYAYTLREQHPALFMEMRLGKTLVAVRRCKGYGRWGKVLVVAPGSALPSWEKEAGLEGCATVNLSVMDTMGVNAELLGMQNARLQDSRFGDKTVFYLLNKEAWKRKALLDLDIFDWTAVILDESTFIKSPTAKVTQYFLERFRHVPHRWILTGTPWPEGAEEVYCQLKFLGHDLLRSPNYWHFRNAHMTQYAYGGWGVRPRSREAVYAEVSRRALVMRRKDVNMGEEKVREARSLSLPEALRKTYRKAENDFILETPENGNVETVWTVTRYNWLRQMCGGFVDGTLVWDGKIQELEALRRGELAGERVVVWCNYNQEVEAINAHFGGPAGKVWALTGKVSPADRWKQVCCWGKIAGGMLVLQQRIAQTGLDLSAADTAIYYSSPVEAVARKQTEDRIVSMEKIKRGVPMLIMDLVVERSVDGDIQKALRYKDSRAESGLSRSRQLIEYMYERNRTDDDNVR